jgi:hypothetical protein
MIRTIAAIAMTLSIGSAIAEEVVVEEVAVEEVPVEEVAAEEAAAPAQSAFAAAIENVDADKDGALSQDEIATIEDKVALEAVLALDANKDGSVDAAEGEASK